MPYLLSHTSLSTDAGAELAQALLKASPFLAFSILFCALWAWGIYRLSKALHDRAETSWKAVCSQLTEQTQVLLASITKKK